MTNLAHWLRVAPRSAATAVLIALASVGVALSIAQNPSTAGPGAEPEAICRWRETTVRVVADASVLDTDLYGNYGDLDELRIGYSADGIWRALTGFAELPDGQGEKLLDATLQLFLKDHEGEKRNTIRACRARLSWTEKGVTWRVLPSAAQPCTTTDVGTELGRYDFDVTEYIAGVWEESFEDLGIVLNSLNERQLNTRFIHGRQSRDGRSQPKLLIKTIPVPEGITATVGVDPLPTGGRLFVNIVNDSFETDVYDVEWFAAEHSPEWDEVAGLSAAQDWSFRDVSSKCEQAGSEIDSDGVRAATTADPIATGQSRGFELSFHAVAVPHQVVMHLSDEQGDVVGRLVVPVGLISSPTPTSEPSLTPTAETENTPTATSTQPTPTHTPSHTASAAPSSTPTPEATPSPSATPGQGWRVYLPISEV